MFQSAKIADLQSRITALETDLATASADLQSATAVREALNGQLTQAQTDLASVRAELTAATEKHTKLEADLETRIRDGVIERCATAGVAPIARDPEAGNETRSMTRAEFDKLPPGEQAAYARSGNKITD